MDAAINLLIVVGLFCLVAYGIWALNVKFGMPQPVLWICGGILIILALIFLGRLVSGSGAPVFYHSWLALKTIA